MRNCWCTQLQQPNICFVLFFPAVIEVVVERAQAEYFAIKLLSIGVTVCTENLKCFFFCITYYSDNY